MSTAHNGDYCQVKDKMCLTEAEANAILKRAHDRPMHKYKCDTCGHYHVSSNSHKRLRKTRNRR